MPTWITLALDIGARAGVALANYIAGRTEAVEQSRIALLPKLSELADIISGLAASEAADHKAVIDEAMKERAENRKEDPVMGVPVPVEPLD